MAPLQCHYIVSYCVDFASIHLLPSSFQLNGSWWMRRWGFFVRVQCGWMVSSIRGSGIWKLCCGLDDTNAENDAVALKSQTKLHFPISPRSPTCRDGWRWHVWQCVYCFSPFKLWWNRCVMCCESMRRDKMTLPKIYSQRHASYAKCICVCGVHNFFCGMSFDIIMRCLLCAWVTRRIELEASHVIITCHIMLILNVKQIAFLLVFCLGWRGQSLCNKNINQTIWGCDVKPERAYVVNALSRLTRWEFPKIKNLNWI